MEEAITPIHRGLSDPRIQEVLGLRLRSYRKAQGLSLDGLAQRTGLSPLTLHKAEHGGNFTVRTLLRVLRALGRLEQLDAFLSPIPQSPLDLIERDSDGG
ncbi:MAG TPA: helix-turn-helix transcriptional regulator [Vicinamibacteria bacterium]|nr:helix-turn-helix transcriptional regulator [Vicinamibacteria bacterium]